MGTRYNKIQWCLACGKRKKTERGKYHTRCGTIIRRIHDAKPENREFIKADLERQYNVKITLQPKRVRYVHSDFRI